MSKIRALELAVSLHLSSDTLRTADAVLSTATMFAAFIGDTESPDVAEVKAALKASSARKPKVQEPPPVIAVNAEPEKAAVIASTAKAEPAKTEPVKAGVTMEEVKALVGKLATNAAAGGAPKAREILGLYGATNLSTLKPEKYALAKASLEAVLQAAEEAAAVAA